MNEDNYVIPYEEFIIAYKDCRKKKRQKRGSLQYERIWMMDLPKLCDEVNNKTYKISESITFIVNDPKQREIFAANFRDRIVQHFLCLRLEPLFEQYFIRDTYNCRKGKGTTYGRNCLYDKIKKLSNNYTEDCWVAKFDMRGFFMSVHKPTLWEMLKEFLEENYHAYDKEYVLWLTEMIVLAAPEYNCRKVMPDSAWIGLDEKKSLFTNGDNYGLPIGNLASQMFANFYLTKFDKMMEDYFDGYYGRYVDDFYVVCKDKQKILKFIPEMRKELAKIQVTLHPKKMYIQHFSKGVSFVGGVCKMDRKYTNSRTVFNCKRLIQKFNNIKELNADHVKDFIQSINSYLGFMRYDNSYAIRRNLVNIIRKDAWQYFYVEGRFLYLKLKKQYTENEEIRQRIIPEKKKTENRRTRRRKKHKKNK